MAETDATILLTERFCPRCGTRFPDGTLRCDNDSTELLPVGAGRDRAGQVLLKKYVLVQWLGEGSFGQVYRATHLKAAAEVAIKLLREERRDDLDARKQFVKEARALMRLHTRHAVVLHDVDEAEDGSLFLVMELLHGIDLDRYRKRGGSAARLPWQEVVRFARHICEALDEAHEADVIHRDLKPANVMIETARDGTLFAKVVDFGIARLASPADLETMTTETGDKITGTPAYMSPEQCRGGTVDGRTDLYALGCILYEMLTGETPFKSGTSQGMIIAHVVETPVSPNRAFSDLAIPADLDRGIMTLLEKDARKRPQTAAEVGRWLDGLLELASRPPKPQKGEARKWLWLAGGVLAAGLLAWAVASMLAGGTDDVSAGSAGIPLDTTVPAVTSAAVPATAGTGPVPGTSASEDRRGAPAGASTASAHPTGPVPKQEAVPAAAATPQEASAESAVEPRATKGESPPGTDGGGTPAPRPRTTDRRPETEPPAASTPETPPATVPVQEAGTAGGGAADQPQAAAPDASESAASTASGASATGSSSSPSSPAPLVPAPDEAKAADNPTGEPVRDNAEGAFDRLHRRGGNR